MPSLVQIAAAALAIVTIGPVLAAIQPKDIGHLWRISRSGMPDSFVFGTIHVADPRVATLNAPVRDALARSQTLAVEMVPEAADSRTIDFELLDAGEQLRPLLGPALYETLHARLLEQGLPAPIIERLKPWAAMMKLRRSGPPSDLLNLDTQLYFAARERGLKILPLELLEEQISAFDTIPLASQVALLRHAVEHGDALATTLEPTIEAWQRGHFRALEGIAGAAYDPYPGMGEHRARMMKSIIDNRTLLMHHRLFTPLRSGHVFIAIGAMHLAGPNGLLQLLRADGYQVTPIW